MTPLFQTLSYNYDDPNGAITDFSANTIAHLDSIPPLIVEWQSADIANNDVSGYFQNPVANSTQIIWNSANSIIILTVLPLDLIIGMM